MLPVTLTTPPLSLADGNAAHLWIFLNWALGLRDAGADVRWLEVHPPMRDDAARKRSREAVAALADRLRPWGLGDALGAITEDESEQLLVCPVAGDRRGSGTLFNFYYELRPDWVRQWPRAALVDIDPGLLQIWWSRRQISVAAHDAYFTIGETVGTGEARFSDCGVEWVRVPPPIHLQSWPTVPAVADGARFSVITGWWDEWMEFEGETFSNEKRESYLRFLELPERVDAAFELAIIPDAHTEQNDVPALVARGWNVADARRVCATLESVAGYIRGARGEFTCARPSSRRLRTCWVSDRSLCYLASGLPVISEWTAPSLHVTTGEGLLQFDSVDSAVAAVCATEADPELHRGRARELAETVFCARRVADLVLNQCE